MGWERCQCLAFTWMRYDCAPTQKSPDFEFGAHTVSSIYTSSLFFCQFQAIFTFSWLVGSRWTRHRGRSSLWTVMTNWTTVAICLGNRGGLCRAQLTVMSSSALGVGLQQAVGRAVEAWLTWEAVVGCPETRYVVECTDWAELTLKVYRGKD